MNAVPPTPPASDPEARLTALLLGELSPAEAAEVQAELACRPDWLDLFTRLARTLPLVREAVREPDSSHLAPPPAAEPPRPPAEAPRLSAERRQALLAAFKTATPSPDFAAGAQPAKRRTPWLALAAVFAALLVVGGGLLLPSLTRARAKAERVSQLTRDRQAELARRLAEGIPGPLREPSPALGIPLVETLDASSPRGQGESESSGRSLGRAAAPASVATATGAPLEASRALPGAAGGVPAPPGARLGATNLKLMLRYGLTPGAADSKTQTSEALAAERLLPKAAVPTPGNLPPADTALMAVPPTPALAPSAGSLSEEHKEPVPVRPSAPRVDRKLFFKAPAVAGDSDRSAPALQAWGEGAAATGPPVRGGELGLLTEKDDDAAGDRTGSTGLGGGFGGGVPVVHPPEVATAENPFSTFSLNVSDVSFRLAAASLEAGSLPEPAGVRVEEFINAFDYRDPAPAPGAPLAFHWERARHPFAHNRELARFSVRTAAVGREPGRALNLVLVLDRSGSMERADRVATCREMLRQLAAQLTPADRLSVVTFARTARLFADGLPGVQAGPVLEEAAALTPEGGTNLEDALRLGYATAARHFLPGGVNRVILITDGAANLGDVMPESLQQLVEENRRRGLALDCFGVGWEDYNDDLLEVLARHGDGRYGFLNAPEEAAAGFAAQLAGALQVAAADVKVQLEFNPARVTRWRLIGYAKHLLAAAQFRDNTVDAAEIGAAEAGNALYALEVNPQGHGPLGVFRVRWRVPATGQYREQEWTLAWSGAAPEAPAASPAMRLALTAALFGEWLAQSPYAGEVSPDRLLPLLAGVPEAWADPRVVRLQQMLEQARALAGR